MTNTNKKSIQIFRGSTSYNPQANNIAQELADGQPFYSKYNNQLYIGDDSKVSDDNIKISTPVGAANLRPGKGDGSVEQISNPNNLDRSAKAEAEGSVAFGGYRYDKTSGKVTTSAKGIQSLATGGSCETYGDWDIVGGHDSKTYQRDNFAFGGGITTGMTEDEFNNYYWDFENDVAQNGGKGTSSSNILDETGKDYEGSYSFCFTTGSSNVNKGRASFVGGENNNNHGKANFNYGQGINNFGNYSVMLGGDQISSNVSSRINNKGNYNFFFGRTGLSSYSNQFNKECNNVILLGSSLRATNDNQVIVGANSGFAVKGTPNLRFAVATGSTPENGTNGFEIYEGGDVRVYSKPTTDYSVVRKIDLTDLNTLINGKINAEEDARVAADSGLSGRIDNLDTKIDTEKGRIDGLDAEIVNINTEIDKLPEFELTGTTLYITLK